MSDGTFVQDDLAGQPLSGSEPPEDDSLRIGGRGWFALGGVFLLLVLVGASSLIALPYVVLSPGPISDTLGKNPDGAQLISVSGTKAYPTTGSLDFTTVRVHGGPGDPVNLWSALQAWVDPSSVVLDEKIYFPQGVTKDQIEQEGTLEMTGSQQDAIAVALRGVGEKVGQKITITGFADSAPSEDVLRTGDQILTVDGAAASDTDTVRAAVQAHRPGEDVSLKVRRGASSVEVSAPTQDSDGQAALGVFLGVAYDFPFDVTVDAGNVGGPSAGLMFSLGIYDTITPGALTGGEKIAGTGTINGSGEVGPIGGIRQKLVGAQRGGATWFLAPAANCNEVVGHVPDGLRVVRVATFGEGRDAVEAIGKDAAQDLPTCTG